MNLYFTYQNDFIVLKSIKSFSLKAVCKQSVYKQMYADINNKNSTEAVKKILANANINNEKEYAESHE